MGITAIDLDDGNMDDINNENQPNEDERTEPAEAEDALEESATSWTVEDGVDTDADDDPTVEEPALDADADPTAEVPIIDADATVEDSVIEDEVIEDEMTTEDPVIPDQAVDDPTVDDEQVDGATIPPIPPAAPTGQPVPQYDRLTRDPYATFGGVLSGIAHRYGWDVALTRLAFVVLLVVSAGTALFAYFLAWLIIPRASHWPPVRVQTGRSRLSSRDLGIGLIALGAIVVLGIGSGDAASVLVPLAMVGGGIWILMQNPREADPVSAAPGTNVGNLAAPFVAPQPMPTAAPYASAQAGASTHYVPTQPPVPAAPVPQRSRLRRFGLIGLFGFLALALLSIIAIPLILIGVLSGGDFEFDSNEEYIFRPASIDAIQSVIVEDVGEITLDLRGVDFDSIGRSDEPVEIDVDLDVGRIEVLVPEDVRVSVDADTDLGEVTVFGSSDEGINPSRTIINEDPQLDLELNLNLGEIVVTRNVPTLLEVN